MNMRIKSILIYIIIAILIIIGCIEFDAYREMTLSKTIKNTLQNYFKNNNPHISSHNFSISNIKIRCRGNNAYLAEFNIIFNDTTLSELNKLGATIYKSNNTWHVKGFGLGLTNEEMKSYKFRCYD